jgi:membrane AbrB-like protein
MVAMSDELEAETPLVAFMQYTRVVLVAVSASLLARFVLGTTGNGIAPQVSSGVIDPIGQIALAPMWLAYLRMAGVATIGAWLGLRLGLPAGMIVGPVLLGVILGAFGVGHGQWPPGVLPAANAVIGINVGLRFHREALRQVWRLLPAVLSLTLILIASCALLGVALMMITGLDLLSTYLATTPGGIDAVTIAALDTGANTAVILPIQILRLLVMVFVGPFLARWLRHRSNRVAHHQAGQEINR